MLFVFSPQRLRELRTERGLSREQLAVAAATTYPAVNSYETGHRSPQRATLLRLAAALGVPPSDLLEPDPELEVAQ